MRLSSMFVTLETAAANRDRLGLGRRLVAFGQDHTVIVADGAGDVGANGDRGCESMMGVGEPGGALRVCPESCACRILASSGFTIWFEILVDVSSEKLPDLIKFLSYRKHFYALKPTDSMGSSNFCPDS